jgi:catechol 2,3-dioxygenase-like lactoylglutathione lyase family enzyme
MELGCFSVSLTVKDLEASRQFYEKLGFEVYAGDASQNWLMMKKGEINIGLFQGMFEKNILTFNPGWDHAAQELESFTDIRQLKREFEQQGLEITNATLEGPSGRGSFMLVDPDGNPILFDQHV